jgi:hypothetical protein
MPKLVNAIPAYCRHKKSGQAVVYIDGREIPLGPHGSQDGRFSGGSALATCGISICVAFGS